MRILVVDECNDNQKLITSILENNGFCDIVTAELAINAFSLFGPGQQAAESVELILMDIDRQGVDGISACHLIKSHQSFKDVPVIVMTASEDVEILDKAFAAGAVDFISKPIKKIELKARVRAALKIKAEVDQRKAREAELIKVLNELEAVNKELSRLSSLDGLTGVANRRHFDQIYDIEWRRAIRTGHELSIVFFDIDFFKRYNDTYGHQEGDECLKLVAAAAGSVLKRPGDLLARYGGEEFVVILPETSVQGALEVAEAIRAIVEQCNIVHRASMVAGHITVSVGVAGGRITKTDKPSDLIYQADTALYEAKNSGRNQVKVAAPLELLSEIADTARIVPSRPDEAAGG